MKKGKVLLVTSILLMNVLLLLPSLIFMPVEALDYGMDQSLGNVDASFQGEDAGDYSGYSVAGAGDVNGDGYDDILIGAFGDRDGGRQAGKAYLIFGKAYPWAMGRDLSASDVAFIGEDADDRSGFSVAGAGDVNGDGYDDILIGAYGGNQAGQTYLILGKASGWAMETDLSASDASYWGEDADDYSGSSIAGVGDVNGDGYDDILIGAYGNDASGNEAGQTYLIFGKASGWSMYTELSASDASFRGEAADDWSGFSIAGAGDVNGDGYDDILVGARFNDEGGDRAGQTYLIFGKASGWNRNADLSASDASFWGEDADDYSGYSVAGGGDVNGDGYDDILIGAQYNEDGGSYIGQTYLILGKTSGWAMDINLSVSDASFWGDKPNLLSRRSVADARDVNGDGYDDILIGAHNYNEGSIRAGQTYLILGKASGWVMNTDLSSSDASFLGEDAEDRSGYSVAGVGDVNGDGYNDILIGAYCDDDGGDRAGQTYLIFPDHNSEPLSITSIKAYSDDEYSHEITSADPGDKIYLELTASDGDFRKNIAQVWIKGSSNPNKRFRLRLMESGENTGKFRGNITITNRTHSRYHWINAADGGWVRITSLKDPTKFINLTIPLTDFTIIPNELFRGEIATICVGATDMENRPEMDIFVLEAQSPTSDWHEINCSYNFEGNNYTTEYITNHTMETGKHSFRAKLTDMQNRSSRWYYFNDILLVKNNPPSINKSFENISVYSDTNAIIDLVPHAYDYENLPSEIIWEVVNYSPNSLFDAYMKNSTSVEIRPTSLERTGLGKIEFKITDKDGGEYRGNVTVEIMNASERPKITIILQSPENGANIGHDSVNLTWSAEGYEGSIIYNVYFGDSIDNMSLKFEELDAEKAEISGLVDDKTYYWKITAEARGIPTIFESEIRHLTVQFGFTPTHIIEMSFETTSLSVKRGDLVMVGLTLRNLGNMVEGVNINVLGDLKCFVNKDDLIHLKVGEEKTMDIKILAGSKFELRTYNLTIEAVFSGERTTASMDVIIDDGKSNHEDNGITSCMLYVIAVILFLAIVAILILVIHKTKKKEEGKDVEVIDAEIELHPSAGITQSELERLSLTGARHGVVPFESEQNYIQPTQQEIYRHTPRPPRVTLSELKVTGEVKTQPKALPQSTSRCPKPTLESIEHSPVLGSPPIPSLVSELYPGASKNEEVSLPSESASPEDPLSSWDIV